ncbi:MAG: AI-2E family transporter [Methanobrevibacter sp.]|uniref:AI-2E family transporter n=1 Tax=Methanobrevibacter millerae TaxID=230361 RepID=A0A8T3VQ73_9EURY|nr:AI-2E family transporter [Methanobrevibacter sp.]MBE6510568.1 AI-2E family transporter [Methanobrevibacter millerae]MBO5151667.1 AI-2E family transporter [Methanobrevibacter sp.]
MEKDFKEYITPPVMLVVLLLAISLIFVFPVLNMIILGAILAYGIRPIARIIQSKLKFESISIILAMIAVLVPLILLIAYIVSVVSGVLTDFLASNPNFDINAVLTQASVYVPQLSPDNISTTIGDIAKYVANYLVGKIGSIANISLDLFILICSVFYFVKDGDKCYNFIKSFVPDDHIEFFDKTVESVENVLKSIFYGHFLTSVIIGIFGAIGYTLLGYPYGIFLGVITGILQLIPIFGPWPIYWALAINDAFNGNYPRVAVVLLFGFFLSWVDMYIRPAISSHHADIHPLILLVGFLAGPLVYGIVGFIVGPLILGITYVVLDSFRKELTESK